MSEAGGQKAAGRDSPRFARFVSALALIGGGISVLLGLTVVVSVVLRSDLVKSSGVPGDFEIAQMLTAVSVFCFLPLCQYQRGHVIVDAASQGWSERWRRRVDGLWEIVAALAMGLIAWQLAQGALGMSQTNTRSMVLGLPIAPAVWACAGLGAIIALVALLKGLENLGFRNLRWRASNSGT